MALDLKTAKNSEGTANIFAVLLLVESSAPQDFCGIQGASMADNLWQNSKNSESTLHYRHRPPCI